ncbi:MAG: bifunctional glutamate N-acetyltransferase/amino-acid acetyltransferase ArgJ [Actinomycetota bacterium]|nr:bifunctional glutamate N-acetyltransferase/amino-acid acetyltransferase ArgJ [Actinomycetota bacterium]MDK1025829.1 bifunctional glutamate N-acetyltransferase/amino-acid acetyltransferase ArgJ [Actinomycetota bacterium]
MSVTAPMGFSAAGVACGIKPDALDLALLVAEQPAVAAGVFTLNQAAAAPVLQGRASLHQSHLKRGIVVNSGIANAGTGSLGMHNAEAMAAALAAEIDCDPEDVLVCSTGTIGPQLPMDRVVPGIEAAVLRLDATAEAGAMAAAAIMTTDSVVKQAVVEGEGWVIGGMSKGAGMVRPNMATMLAFITTDAAVGREVLQSVLAAAVDISFNSLNIDACESTNDTVIALASGASDISPEPNEFATAMEDLCRDLALQMAKDAEGASRVVTINVRGAGDDAEARYLGRLVADSALVRSSFYGGDVNWGRILGALGTADVVIDSNALSISYCGIEVFSSGTGAEFGEVALLESMETGDFAVRINVGAGSGRANIVTTDLTPEYVVFNGERS